MIVYSASSAVLMKVRLNDMSCSTCKHEELKAHEFPCSECDWENMEKFELKEELKNEESEVE